MIKKYLSLTEPKNAFCDINCEENGYLQKQIRCAGDKGTETLKQLKSAKTQKEIIEALKEIHIEVIKDRTNVKGEEFCFFPKDIKYTIEGVSHTGSDLVRVLEKQFEEEIEKILFDYQIQNGPNVKTINIRELANASIKVLEETATSGVDKTDEPKPEEPKAEDKPPEGPKTEEPKAEDKPPDEPKPEEPKAEDKPPEGPKTEEPKAEDKPPDEPKPEEPKAEDKPPEGPKTEEPKAEDKPPDEPKP
ncbi:MAG: hypothetical protein LBJ09_02515, partial [Clostridiales bacterium]|nr:hypothetical protein [Clostridiales bacterium]